MLAAVDFRLSLGLRGRTLDHRRPSTYVRSDDGSFRPSLPMLKDSETMDLIFSSATGELHPSIFLYPIYYFMNTNICQGQSRIRREGSKTCASTDARGNRPQRWQA